MIPPFPIVTNLQMRPLCAAATVSPAGNYLHCDAARFEGLDELRYPLPLRGTAERTEVGCFREHIAAEPALDLDDFSRDDLFLPDLRGL